MEYERFCGSVGEALAQAGLERAPLLTPVPHVPTLDSPLNFLNFEERNIVSGALKKLSKYPDQLSNILEVFKVSYFGPLMLSPIITVIVDGYEGMPRKSAVVFDLPLSMILNNFAVSNYNLKRYLQSLNTQFLNVYQSCT